MHQYLTRIVVTFLFALSAVALGTVDLQAGVRNPCSAKNPCAKNPCGKNPCMENPCAKNPCGGNPCAMKPKPVRKVHIRDSANLMEMGEKLWNNTKLGTSGMACGHCHADGAGLKTGPFPKYITMADDILTLDQMINFCMINPMKGKPLPWNSEKMTALAAYARTSARGGEVINPCSMKHPCGMKNPCAKKNPCGKKNPCSKKNPCAKNPCGTKNPCGKM